MEAAAHSSPVRKVHVTGFPTYTQPQDLTRIFANYGSVKVDRMTNKFAVLSFTDEDEASEAIEDTDKVNIYGEFLTVRPYTAKEGDSEPSSPKREFVRSKQKCEIIDPQLIDLSGDFHQQLDNVLSAVRLTQEEVSALSSLYVDLEWVLQQQWPGSVAMPFGSITTGLGIKSSDADCFINVPQQFRQPNANFVNKAKKLLQQYPRIFAEILSIPRANTPIVKFFHIPTETNCDVTFKTALGAQNSKLIAFLLHADPRLVPMAVVIKYWAKVHGFSGTGKLTNYALTMLIIFYLQQPRVAILPSVSWLQQHPIHDIIIDDWNTGFMHAHEHLPRTANTAPISELLGGFFEYYASFNFEHFIVCPLTGFPIRKDFFKDLNLLPIELERYVVNLIQHSAMPLRFTSSICVQDPIELSHNVASPINSRLAAEIKEYLKFAAAAYEKEKPRKCLDFLKTILLQKPKLPRAKGAPDFRVVVYPHILQCIKQNDWESVVREVWMKVFDEVCKIKLDKIEMKPEPQLDPKKKSKEKYVGIVTKAIWKRKQFSKLYSVTHMDFLKKQTLITEDILKVDKETINIVFHFTITFHPDPRNVSAAVRFVAGDTNLFREFGKFFISSVQSWYLTMLKVHFQPCGKNNPNSSTANEESNTVNKKDISDSRDKEENSQSEGTSDNADSTNLENKNYNKNPATGNDLNNLQDNNDNTNSVDNIENISLAQKIDQRNKIDDKHDDLIVRVNEKDDFEKTVNDTVPGP